ncbi:hypothetical protein Tco_1422077 [Tanacetum coccineum]
MAKLVQLQICYELADTSDWVAPGLERQPDAAAGAPKVVEGALNVDKGAQAEEVHGIRESLAEQREVMDAMARDFSRFTRRRVRQRTGEANTSATPLDEDQPDL